MIDQLTKYLKLNSSFTLRVLTAAVGIPLLGLIIWLDGIWFTLFAISVGVSGTSELYKLWPNTLSKTLISTGMIWTGLICVIGYFGYYWVTLFSIGLSLLVSIPITAGLQSRTSFLRRWLLFIAGPMYVGFCLTHSIFILKLLKGTELLVSTVATVFTNDSVAYLIGKNFGKNHIYGSISPNKTLEGTLGGFVASTAIFPALCTVFSLPFNVLEASLLGFIIGISGQLGDLLESFLKRKAKVKNSGHILPGHGGILDRLDSIVFPLVIIYYCALLAGL
tara:strand:- start:1406 stop:2239 length:834 start_codon:yes stop_codon:yes gene_type:complete